MDIVERLRSLAREYWQHRQFYTEAAAEIEQLRAALSWVDEVYPGRNPDSGGAIVYMTWEQWNAMREAVGLKPQPVRRK